MVVLIISNSEQVIQPTPTLIFFKVQHICCPTIICLFRYDRFRVFFLLLFRVFIWSALNLNILFQLCRTKEALKKRIQQRLPKPRPKKTMPPSQNPPRRSKILKRYNTQLHTMVQANIYTKKHIYFYVEVLNFTYHLQIHSQKEFFYLQISSCHTSFAEPRAQNLNTISNQQQK